jgi:integrase
VKKGRTRSEVWTAYADWVAVTGKKLAPRPDNATASMKPLDARHVLPLHAACYPHPQLSGGPGAFAGILTAAEVGEGYTFHSWRHTFRTRLSEAGVSDDLAKRLGGWTEDATAARYDHAERVEEMRAAVEKAR